MVELVAAATSHPRDLHVLVVWLSEGLVLSLMATAMDGEDDKWATTRKALCRGRLLQRKLET